MARSGVDSQVSLHRISGGAGLGRVGVLGAACALSYPLPGPEWLTQTCARYFNGAGLS